MFFGKDALRGLVLNPSRSNSLKRKVPALIGRFRELGIKQEGVAYECAIRG
jgi:hypothetical protein